MTVRIETLAEGVTLHNADCREVLPKLRAGSVDLILTDPPYGNANHINDLNKRLNDYRGIDNKPIANDDAESMRDVLDAMLTQASRLLREEASACCCFCGGGGPRPVFAWLAERLDRGGLQFFHSVIWDKLNPGLGWRFRRQHEMLLVAHRAGGKLLWADDAVAVPNIYPQFPPRDRVHPNEKPLALMDHFLLLMSRKNQLVVDPFMGSGTTGVAAARHGRRFMGIETCPDHFETACRRISEALKAPALAIERPAPATQEALL